ncbi:MAG: FmdE family protein [Desulforhabdus sp.]|jgi:formylmethanofuran dehydrogenase subunit E|nr:FmdE family protein [Desulforhabdus sp.]
MTEKFTKQNVVDQVVAFHGHMCPGLAIGMRASEIALKEIGPHALDEEVVAVVETDMYGVDAIQFLTGCTFGKGNLIHLDYGKNAFSFYRRSDGKAIRIVMRSDAFGSADKEWEKLVVRLSVGNISPQERQRFQHKKDERSRLILQAPLEALFEVKQPSKPMPRSARVQASLDCEKCGEKVMESRVRRLRGKTLCIPCFELHEPR